MLTPDFKATIDTASGVSPLGKLITGPFNVPSVQLTDKRGFASCANSYVVGPLDNRRSGLFGDSRGDARGQLTVELNDALV